MRRKRGDALASDPPHHNLQACVILPARNEEDLLLSALEALATQTDLGSRPLSSDTYEVILLINNSTDRTAQVAASFTRLCPALRLHVVERNFDSSHAHIGHVRRLLMDEACRRARSSRSAVRPHTPH